MRARRSVLYVIQRFSIVTSPMERPPQSIRPPATSDARSWKLRTARDRESLRRSNRAKGDGGVGASGAAAGAAGATGAGCVLPDWVRRGAGRRAAGDGDVTRATSFFARSSKPAHGKGSAGFRILTYQYAPAPMPTNTSNSKNRFFQ